MFYTYLIDVISPRRDSIANWNMLEIQYFKWKIACWNVYFAKYHVVECKFIFKCSLHTMKIPFKLFLFPFFVDELRKIRNVSAGGVADIWFSVGTRSFLLYQRSRPLWGLPSFPFLRYWKWFHTGKRAEAWNYPVLSI